MQPQIYYRQISLQAEILHYMKSLILDRANLIQKYYFVLCHVYFFKCTPCGRFPSETFRRV